MTLPYSRPSNPTTGEAVSSADIAEIMDAIVRGAKNVRKRTFWPQPFYVGSFSIDVATFVGRCIVSAAGGLPVNIGVPVEDGDRILGFSCLAYGDGAVDTTHLLEIEHTDMSLAAFASALDVNRAAVWGSVAYTLLAGVYTMLPGEGLRLTVSANAANARIGLCSLLYDHP